MPTDPLTLARRAVSCPRFAWRAGMLAIEDATPGSALWRCPWRVLDGEAYSVAAERGIPDLTDAATLGCVLALVREAWDCPSLSVAVGGDSWYVVLPSPRLGRFAPLADVCTATEAESLVTALEAAPGEAG